MSWSPRPPQTPGPVQRQCLVPAHPRRRPLLRRRPAPAATDEGARTSTAWSPSIPRTAFTGPPISTPPAPNIGLPPRRPLWPAGRRAPHPSRHQPRLSTTPSTRFPSPFTYVAPARVIRLDSSPSSPHRPPSARTGASSWSVFPACTRPDAIPRQVTAALADSSVNAVVTPACAGPDDFLAPGQSPWSAAPCIGLLTVHHPLRPRLNPAAP